MAKWWREGGDVFANSNMMVRRLPSRAGREKLILGILQKKKGTELFRWQRYTTAEWIWLGNDTHGFCCKSQNFFLQLYAFWTKYNFACRLPFSLDQPPAVGGFLRRTNISSPVPTNISFLVSRNISHHRLSKTSPSSCPRQILDWLSLESEQIENTSFWVHIYIHLFWIVNSGFP